MKNSEHLFFLIQSLSKSEKRNFKLSLSAYSKEAKNSILLFDILDKMNVYDHDLLIKKVTKSITKENIAPLKANLMSLLLRSLQNLKKAKGTESELRQKVDYIKILIDKGIYSLAKKRLIKAKQMALEVSSFPELLQLNKLEWQIVVRDGNPDNLREYLTNSREEQKKLMELNQVFEEFQRAVAHMNLLRNEKATWGDRVISEEELEALIIYPALHLEIENYPGRCQMDYHAVWGYYHAAKKNQKLAYFHQKKALVLCEEIPSRLIFWSRNAHNLLTTLSLFQMYGEYTKELNYVVRKAETFSKSQKSFVFEFEFKSRILVAQIDRDLVEGRFEQFTLYIDQINTFYAEHENKFNQSQKIVFLYNFSYIYLGLNDYKQALKWMNEILNNPKYRKVRKDVNAYALIINICIHYALGHFNLIPSLVKSTKRYLNNFNLSNEILDDFLELARFQFSKQYSKSTKDAFEKFNAKWKDVNEGNIKFVFYYFNLVRWLESRIEINQPEQKIDN